MNLKDYLLSFNIFYDNEYLEKYINLISSNSDRCYEKFRTNVHHIIPRTYYTRRSLEVDSTDTNTVNLLYKDHILAHYYLCLCLSDKQLKWDSEYSIRYILNNKNFKASSDYEQEKSIIENLDQYQTLHEELSHHIGDIHRGKTLSEEHRKILSEYNKKPKSLETRKKISKSKTGVPCKESTKLKLSEINSGKKLSEDTKNKISANSKINDNYGFKGRHHSEEAKLKLSNKATEQWSSEEARQQQSERQKNRHFKWYNDGVKCIQINQGDEIPEGFVEGRIYKRKNKKEKL